MGTKQCAGCGAQIASTARVCPVCGRGSLFGELGMLAFLGVLLLGIGLASGLIPLNRPAPQPEPAAAPVRVAAPVLGEKPKATRPPKAPHARPTVVAARAILAQAPCANPDTSAVVRLLREDKAADPARLRAVACQASIGYQSASPDTAPPETAAVNPPATEPIFITTHDPYDSTAH
jgi:hypothetical protein